jgi:hypothetical protein
MKQGQEVGPARLGACDHISVVIRTTLLLVRTPDEMRGGWCGQFALYQHFESIRCL